VIDELRELAQYANQLADEVESGQLQNAYVEVHSDVAADAFGKVAAVRQAGNVLVVELK